MLMSQIVFIAIEAGYKRLVPFGAPRHPGLEQLPSAVRWEGIGC
jgi:hypothetical protein